VPAPRRLAHRRSELGNLAFQSLEPHFKSQTIVLIHH
jgi:hypothetical protein